jgi:hypothetical protein
MRKKIIALTAAIAVAAGLAACETATPYQPNVPGQKASGGYSEVRVEPDRFRVTFAGNSLTSRPTVEAYLLYRSAELTVEQGYDWFNLVDRNTERETHTYVNSFYSPWYGGYGYWRPYWRYYGGGYGWRTWDPYWGGPFWADSVDVHTIQKFEATAEIVLHKGPKPAGDPAAFDARAVVQNLKPHILYPAPPSH